MAPTMLKPLLFMILFPIFRVPSITPSRNESGKTLSSVERHVKRSCQRIGSAVRAWFNSAILYAAAVMTDSSVVRCSKNSAMWRVSCNHIPSIAIMIARIFASSLCSCALNW